VTHSKPPQQERSRQSFERALDAAVTLLTERGADTFTLAEVAQRAEVSIGSIYGRVKSKDDLLRSVQVREFARIDAECSEDFSRSGELGDLRSAARFAIEAAGALLRRNASILRPFMLLANTDDVIATAGRQSHLELVDRFTEVLLSKRELVGHPDPVTAVNWTFTVVYSVIARYLALGSSAEAAGQGDWDQMLTNLTDMTVSFLTSKPSSSDVAGWT
jgi:AcrR family transcriptional regulator